MQEGINMKCTDYDESCNGCPKKKRCITGITLGVISFTIAIISLSCCIPNEFRIGGVYSEAIPFWMIALCYCGVIAISFSIGFLIYIIISGMIGNKEINKNMGTKIFSVLFGVLAFVITSEWLYDKVVIDLQSYDLQNIVLASGFVFLCLCSGIIVFFLSMAITHISGIAKLFNKIRNSTTYKF